MAAVLALAIPAAGADVKRPTPKSPGGKAGWVSQEYLKRHPDAIPGRPIPKRFLRPEEPATPKTALQCKDQVCTDVTGKRDYVTRWGTKAGGNAGCTSADFDWSDHGKPFAYKGKPVCPKGKGPGVYYDYSGPVGYFQDGAQLCNSWKKIKGFSCIEIVD